MYSCYWGNWAVSESLKAPPAGRELICIFNKPISSNMFLLLHTHFIFFVLSGALLFQSIKIISLCYSLYLKILKVRMRVLCLLDLLFV